ncbi:MAG TPA: sigma factor [Trebonia sp.]|nr:sigma factor [Trebonia sp.]
MFARHAPWLAVRLRAALSSPDVEDVLQETFLAVWKGASTYTPRGTPRAWLWVIARNQAALLGVRDRFSVPQAGLSRRDPRRRCTPAAWRCRGSRELVRRGNQDRSPSDSPHDR